jgi:sensor histidine kinase YesM
MGFSFLISRIATLHQQVKHFSNILILDFSNNLIYYKAVYDSPSAQNFRNM